MQARRRNSEAKSLSFGHIVSAVDFTVASAVALRTVLDLIRRTGARLTLVHAFTTVRWRHAADATGTCYR